MTVIDELRLLLDERGVNWDYGITGAMSTKFSASGIDVTFVQSRDGLVCSTILTPEQVIEVTLGLETCRFEFDQKASDHCQGPVYSCDKCGALSYTNETDQGKFKFCPNCQRRVRR